MRASRAWNAAVVFLVAAVAFRILSRTTADPDLWGHVLYGMRHLETGSLARVDSYSYLTGDHPWINHEILSELAFGWLFVTFGPTGLIVFKTALAMGLVALLYLHLCRRGLEPLRAGIVVVVVAYLLSPGLSTVRPQMFTYLFFALLLVTLDVAERGNPRWLWAVPPLMTVWINFHGGVLAGLGVIVLWACAHLTLPGLQKAGLLEHRSPVALPVAMTVAFASGAALLINPYGWALPEFLLRTGTVPRPEIMEWIPVRLDSVEGGLYLLLLVAGLVAIARSGRTRRFPLLVPAAVIALLPLLANRHLQLFAIAFVVLAGSHVADLWGARAASADRSRLRPVFLGVAALAGLLMLTAGVPHFRCVVIDPEKTQAFPARAMALLEETGAEGKLLLPFGWGQYAIWRLSPDVQVSMDGRRETVYPDSIYRKYLRFRSGVGSWDAFVDVEPPDVALLPTGSVTANLVSLRSDWVIVYHDPTATLLARPGSPLEARLRAAGSSDLPSDGAGLCFP